MTSFDDYCVEIWFGNYNSPVRHSLRAPDEDTACGMAKEIVESEGFKNLEITEIKMIIGKKCE